MIAKSTVAVPTFLHDNFLVERYLKLTKMAKFHVQAKYGSCCNMIRYHTYTELFTTLS